MPSRVFQPTMDVLRQSGQRKPGQDLLPMNWSRPAPERSCDQDKNLSFWRALHQTDNPCRDRAAKQIAGLCYQQSKLSENFRQTPGQQFQNLRRRGAPNFAALRLWHKHRWLRSHDNFRCPLKQWEYSPTSCAAKRAVYTAPSANESHQIHKCLRSSGGLGRARKVDRHKGNSES